MSNENQKELIELVDLVIDAVKDGIAAGKDGFQITDVTYFANLIPEFVPAFAGLDLVPAEVKAMTFQDDSDLVKHVVARLGVTSAKALNIISSVLNLAADAYSLVQAIKAPAA